MTAPVAPGSAGSEGSEGVPLDRERTATWSTSAEPDGSADPAAPVPVWRRLALGRAMPDRAAHHRLDAAWLDEAWKRARVLLLDDRGRAVVEGAPESPRLVWFAAEDPAAAVSDDERLFLAEDGDVPYFALLTALPDVLAEGQRPASLREVGAQLSPLESALLTEAVGLANWHRDYRYGPRTGTRLGWRAGGWEAEAVDGSEVVYPRTNPAIIVLTHDGVPGDEGRCLLTRGLTWPEGRYSCVAGFVEPGESAEAAVFREVAEETGVRIREVRYLASQAWPLPASLMLGFYAIADSDQPVVIEEIELADARWFTRGELRGRGPGPAPIVPPPLSIAHELLTAWRDERV
ncbi:NAD(+) diphosphatase [Cryptosporangium aurantiacum]|uniref:NAD(+) diphosphatase n=1 Tax=Cryptosporangium aurantiacum TaxID=134849 RepID=A0A1M7QP57_9ACTN|nr:NAD(+) diphosphatase [Cryptosporangium aurantiacum]SHN32921.1 NAD+ diphosphatase [Cryptosporangium aurantiacum]